MICNEDRAGTATDAPRSERSWPTKDDSSRSGSSATKSGSFTVKMARKLAYRDGKFVVVQSDKGSAGRKRKAGSVAEGAA